MVFPRSGRRSLRIRAELKMRSEQYEDALSLFKEYTAKRPDDVRGYLGQARTSSALGRYEERPRTRSSQPCATP